MKTSTKIRIGLCIILSILMLGLIGKKTREKFEGQQYHNSIQGYVPNMASTGFKINNRYRPDSIPLPKKVNTSCEVEGLSQKDKEEHIYAEAHLAKQKYQAFLRNRIDKMTKNNSNSSEYDTGMNPSADQTILGTPIDSCYMKFPALL